MRNKVLLAGTIVAALLALLPASERSAAIAGASGGSDSQGMSVLVTVAATGSITSVSDLDFGNFDNSGAVDGTAPLSVQVSNGTPYDLSIDAGSNYDGSTRHMSQAIVGDAPALATATTIPYFLYKEAGHSNEWGDLAGTYGSGSPVSSTGTGGEDSYTVFGQIPVMGSTPEPGNYNDFVTVTLNF